MIRTVEAVIDQDGRVHLLEPMRLASDRRALVMILDEQPGVNPGEAALLSEASLAKDWTRPEEDLAWAHLQSDPSF